MFPTLKEILNKNKEVVKEKRIDYDLTYPLDKFEAFVFDLRACGRNYDANLKHKK